MTFPGEDSQSWLRMDAPGRRWGGAKLLHGLHRPLGSYQPVLALTILRYAQSRPEILVGVRDPKANKYHQNVASVPTRRIQPAVAKSWLWLLRTYRTISAARRADLRDEVANIFSRKLGLADAQEREEVYFEVEALAAFQGISVIGEQPDGRPATENLTMFNALIRLYKGDEALPRSTASYCPLVWASTDDFIEMTTTRDAGRLKAGLDESFFCAYGLCLQTSTEMLRPLNHVSPPIHEEAQLKDNRSGPVQARRRLALYSTFVTGSLLRRVTRK